jgi:GlcNAc-P-P-Und epimerase
MKKLLLTGAYGFVGNYIYNELKEKFIITTLGLEEENDININLAKDTPLLNKKYDIVVHAAGKAHVMKKSENESLDFLKINLIGTQNLCKSLELNKPKVFIFISTVAVYGLDSGKNIDETYPLKGTSPYALSKIQSENFLINWCAQNEVILGILRPSLIAGKNPPGNLKIMINGIKSGYYFRIGKGGARKSVLMAQDIAYIIPKLAEIGGIYNICDNHHPSFAELDTLISKQLNAKKPGSIPLWIAKSLAKIGDIFGSYSPINSDKLEKITNSLTFSNEKAKKYLGWEPLDVLENLKIN